MKTRFILVLFCVTLFSVSYAQNPSYKNQGPQPIRFNSNTNASLNNAELAKLKEVYGAALKTEILDRPTRVLTIKEILRNRVILREITDPNKQKPCPKLSEIPLFDAFVSTLKRDTVFNPYSFNPLKYDFKYHRPGFQLIRVDNTNYFIIIKPQHYNN
ncbi:MAG: hypothetical protein CMP78_06690 [Formosa sp.]|jgi:hypothetical protein|nr:hypothetical protein [Formosa sp.]|tara:strand:- start:1561 stop:2034 length:474 start_codon:yes stop_codon:yes gene_type:complete